MIAQRPAPTSPPPLPKKPPKFPQCHQTRHSVQCTIPRENQSPPRILCPRPQKIQTPGWCYPSPRSHLARNAYVEANKIDTRNLLCTENTSLHYVEAHSEKRSAGNYFYRKIHLSYMSRFAWPWLGHLFGLSNASLMSSGPMLTQPKESFDA